MVAEVVGTSGGLEPIKPGPNRLFMDTCQVPDPTLHTANCTFFGTALHV